MGTVKACQKHGIINCHDCFYKAEGKSTNDLPRAMIEVKMKEWQGRGFTCWAKWTCVRCGERNVAEKSGIIEEKHVCAKCKYVNTPDEFGIRMEGPRL